MREAAFPRHTSASLAACARRGQSQSFILAKAEAVGLWHASCWTVVAGSARPGGSAHFMRDHRVETMSNDPDSKPATILVVDDNEANRLLAQGTLEDEGYRVVLATDGAEGIAAFEREDPACVLLDVRMPGIDGFAVCKRIRALPGGTDTPVIFLTAQRDVDTLD